MASFIDLLFMSNRQVGPAADNKRSGLRPTTTRRTKRDPNLPMSNHDQQLCFDNHHQIDGGSSIISHWITVSGIIFFSLAAILTPIFYLCALIHQRERRALAIVYQRMTIAATQTPSHGRQRRRGLESSLIFALPKISYKKANDAARNECAICLSGLEEGEIVNVLPHCNHFFHVKCIDEWLQSHSTCPVCRGGVELQAVESAGEQETARSATASDG